ncbi:Hypothetical Protein OBI_RACECAR_218 [Arthrobacter phage Racecar]|nr:hypothetical protein PBI_RACECAR_10 [Arthrobacter phage Racecar]QFG12695.1 hypothetical protein PBI_MIMI_10 [Arthrobacter phage Mimi]
MWFWWVVLFTVLYAIIGWVCVPVLTRDAYRRRRLAKPKETEEASRLEAASQAWADAIFWPVYITQHLSLTVLDRDRQKVLDAERTQRYLRELETKPSDDWQSKFKDLTDEGG